jgi:hypothetical protein
MTPNYRYLGARRREALSRLAVRLLREDSGVTSLQYFMAAVVLALVAIAASRSIAGVLESFLYRIHVIATMATP